MSTATSPDPTYAPSRRANPYVGPHAFRYGESLYGRTREITDVRRPADRRTESCSCTPPPVLERARCSRPACELSRSVSVASQCFRLSASDTNRARPSAGSRMPTVMSPACFASLEEARPAERQLSPEELGSIGINNYLQRCDDELAPGSDGCLVFDQFEELFTLDETDQATKSEFLSPRWGWHSAIVAAGPSSPCGRTSSPSSIRSWGLIPTHFSARYRLETCSLRRQRKRPSTLPPQMEGSSSPTLPLTA